MEQGELEIVQHNFAELFGCRFQRCDLRNVRFAQTYMNNTNFSGADLSGAVFDTSAFENADFTGANLQGIKYDSIALGFFAVSKLDGAKMSSDLRDGSGKIAVREIRPDQTLLRG